MKNETFYLLGYSGMDRCDFDPSWYEENESYFCKTCHRQKYFESALDVVVDGVVRERSDMIFTGLIPGSMSYRMRDALGGDLDRYLNIGTIFSQVGGERKVQPYVAFTGVLPYVTLRGRNPSIFNGRSFPEGERIYTCPECKFTSRRERRPFFLMESECPEAPISCVELGLLVRESVYEKIKQIKWKKVGIDKVEVVDG
ncbi:hypothetical protein BLA13014_04050 [Burkholderia aenigmatica]|uniref:Uncharacterized protein n=1 Tax=Burkholderia aenigmatica TaxID=2015348 RepID=A0A6P2N460_9BURK|nr:MULTISPECIES: hypothetical protein [Burkholderia]VWB87532.1 hypothetical protein BLA13014_04050 [Burkholderia aenigmatica]